MENSLKSKTYTVHSAEKFLKEKNLLPVLIQQNGLLLINDIDTDKTALALANMMGTTEHCIDSSLDGITVISNKQTIKNAKNSLAFTQAGLYPHTDRSPIAFPPKFLLNWTIQPAKQGGDSLLCDAKKIFQHLKQRHPSTCNALFNEDMAEFSDSINTYKGAIFQEINGALMIRFRRDNCVALKENMQKYMHTLYEAIDLHTFSIPTTKNNGYLIDNTR